MRRRSSTWMAAALAVAFTISGCRKPGGDAGPRAAPTPAVAQEAAAGGGTPSPDPEALSPVIHEAGLPGELPDRVVIDLARDLVPQDRVGSASERTVVTLTPAAGAAVVWERTSTLAVKLARPLQYDTVYAVEVERIEAQDGTISGKQPWRHEFRTPPFGFVRLGLGKARPPAQPQSTTGAAAGAKPSSAEVELVFSGPVKAEAVAPFVSWRIAGKRIAAPRLSGTDRPNVVRAAIGAAGIEGATIQVALRAGAPSLQRGVVAPAAEGEVAVPGGEPMTIHAALLREGSSGYYVEVVCDDAAAKGGRRHYWDPQGSESYEVSHRCLLGAEAAAHAVHLSPKAKVSVAPGPGGFRVFADLARGPVVLTIDAGVRTEAGGVLQDTFQRELLVPARRPALSFASGGRYLPRSAWRSLPVSHTNVDAAQLTVRRIPPENLVYWLSEDRNERATERTSDVVLKKMLALSSPQDRPATTWVDVASLLPSTTQGVLELTLEGGGARASSRLLLTSMNLIAKRSADPKEKWRQKVRVWALDIDSTEPLAGVEVAVVRKSGKVVGRCTTAADQGCAIQVGRDDADESEPFAIVARKGEDLTYVRYADLRTDTSDADVSGEPFAAEAAYRAALWSDRGVYRPGDVAHVAAVVRDRAHHAPPAGMPVELQLLDPREKVARRVVVKTNEAGLVAVDLPFEAYADTGRHQVVAMAGDRRIGTYAFNVEEFVPERMKVNAAVERPAYLLGESASVSVDARYLFGGSAEGSPVEVTCSLTPTTFRPARENAQFTYGPYREGGPGRATALGSVQGALDKDGKAKVACPEGEELFAGPARLVASAAVFEAGSGRSSLGEGSAAVHPERFYLGLQTGVTRAEIGKPVPVAGVVVDWSGALAPKAVRTVELELFRMEPEYGWWWDEDEGGETARRNLHRISEGTRTVDVAGGKFAVELTPAEGGVAYVVRATAGKAITELWVEADARGWWWYGEAQADQTPRPLKAASLAVELPRAVKVGEKAVARVTVPFRGRALFTVETDDVVTSEWRKVEPGEVSWPFTVRSFAPNVYVSAFLVKDPHLESKEAFLPDRAFGVASAAVEPAEFTAPLRLEVPAELRSSSPLTVKLDAGKSEGATFAVVAVVDEGILQLTRMKSPDPLEILFARRALGVDTFETVGWTLLVKPQGPSRKTGGDGGGEGAGGRVQPVKPVALWSGIVPLGPDGKAEVKVDVPQYRGQLRVMAVTAGPKRLGRASASVTVKDPIVLSTTLPRFAVQDDLMQIPVFLTNLSGAPQVVKVSLAAEPLPVPGMASPPVAAQPLVFVGKSEGSARLADGASATLVFQVRAGMAVGAARLRVTAKAGPHESREELDVPFLPAGPRERVVTRLEVTADALDLAPSLRGWVPTSERTTFWLTANPYAESFDHLKYLLHYPYGCVEQTTSSARPLLFAGNLIDSVDPALTAGGKLDDMVMAGVRRLLSMQTSQGGLSYWPGGAEPYGWGTAYATHFLLDAQKAGYAVPQDRLDEILGWIEAEVARHERGQPERSGYHEGAATEAYLHYVLALSGKGHKARLQELIAKLPQKADGETLERRYMLQAALYLAGDRRYEQELRNPDASAVTDERRNTWSFYSDRRRRGFMLSTFQDLFGADPAGEALAQRVAEGLKHPSGWYTTQELVWGVTGLGKRVGAVNRSFGPGRLVADGKVLEPRPPRPGASDRTWFVARASERRALSLELPKRGQGKVWLLVSSEGVREKPQVEYGGRGLSITRTWRTPDGAGLDPRVHPVDLAGLLHVELELRNTTGEDVQNLFLVDRIPAGFEIENPRLGRGTTPAWASADEQWGVEHMDVRDHELTVFGRIPKGQSRTVIYAVRAVTAGTFTLPPVEAGAMYDPATWARAEGGRVTVNGPWKDDLL